MQADKRPVKGGSQSSSGASFQPAAALRSCRSAFVGMFLLSGLSNVLMLTGAFFMLEVYDRVLPSRSMPTLIGLAVLAGLLYGFLGVVDLVRARLIARVGQATTETLGGPIYHLLVRLPSKLGELNDGMQPMRDLDQVRGFFAASAPMALFDLPWMPLYLGVCYFLHPLIGLTASVGGIALILLTIVAEIAVRAPTKKATELAMTRRVLAETSRRNADVIIAMGMASRLQNRWDDISTRYLSLQQQVGDRASTLSAISRTLRFGLQSAVLGVGAYLVIYDQATAGIIIAGSILAARALAPVDLAIGNWRTFVAARQSWTRLKKLASVMPMQVEQLALPDPTDSVSVQSAAAAPPGTTKIVLQDISFTLKRGDGLGIIGPSASGKSSLVKILVGAWHPVRGRVCLDGAALDQWSPDALGRHIGYLPQEVELISGTVAENICRFEPEPDPEAIVEAAKAAGVHELITGLKNGYQEQVGEEGAALSAGQRQWIALARALHRDPFLVVLDEPNSNLDSSGEEALTRAIAGVRKRGGVVVVVAHRPSALAALDNVLVLSQGRMQAVGPRDEILGKVLRRDQALARPLRVVPDVEGAKP